jgi:hypothetical protein
LQISKADSKSWFEPKKKSRIVVNVPEIVEIPRSAKQLNNEPLSSLKNSNYL